MSTAQVGRNIILSPVGTKQKNSQGDVRRVQQLLLRSRAVPQRRKSFADDGRWNGATEEALASALGLMFASFRDAVVRPVEKDPGLLNIAVGAEVAVPLLPFKGRKAALQLHERLLGKNLTYARDTAVYVTRPDGGEWHALFWDYNGEGAYFFDPLGARLACNCTTYANLLLAAFHAPYAGGGAFEPSVNGTGPKNSLGERYGMKRVGHKPAESARAFFGAEADPRKLYYLDVGSSGAHCVIVMSPGADKAWYAYHCSARHKGAVTEALKAFCDTSSYLQKGGCVIWEGRAP
jgi:hypothetical protein